ncbi:MAG: calcium/sodium antiporter [Nitrospiria bacterium]
MLKDLVFILIGLLLLTGGGDTLVSGASRLARRLGVSPLVVGLTIVALGTSAPEMAVSLSASLTGRGDIAVGNVVGSNISNIGLALGLAAIFRPLVVQIRLVRFEVPLLFVITVLTYLIALTGEMPRWFGTAFLLGLAAYIVMLYRWSLREPPEVEAEYAERETPDGGGLRDAGKVIFGLAALAGGGNLLVEGAVGVARWAGLSELVIGLTVVAVGTSLPEMVTAIIAVLKNHSDIAIGNVLGSNIFNTLGVLGATAAVQPISVQKALLVRDLPVMGFLTFLLIPFLRSGLVLKRREGVLLVAIYCFYIVILLMYHS